MAAATKMMAHDKGAALEFFIFGHPVAYSASPEIHAVGFLENGFRHRYGRFDVEDHREVVAKLRSEACGGGSVTIPHKESVLEEAHVLSDAAAKIKAVNTVTKSADGKLLYGDNTDWLGIKNRIEARLPSGRSGPLTALLCGAGGTARAACYALQQMQASRVLIYNRTAERAATLAEEFGFEVCRDLAGLSELGRLDVVVHTLPGASRFVLPDASVLRRFRPVVLEAAYIPRRTAFLEQAIAAGCPFVEGVEMLFEQGCAQCEIWTGQPAPRPAIAAAMLEALFAPGSQHPAHDKMEPFDALPATLVQEAKGGDECSSGMCRPAVGERSSAPSAGAQELLNKVCQ